MLAGMAGRGWAAWSVVGCLGVLLHACGGKVDDVPAKCEPGSVRVCGGNGVAGPCYQQCAASGDGYSHCDCSVSSGGSGGLGGYPVGGGGYPVGGGGYPPGGGGYPPGGAGGDPWGGGGGGPCAGCPSYKIGGLLDMPACCLNTGACAVSVVPGVGALIGLNQGCYPTNQPGSLDPSCPSLVYTNPLDGGLASHPGCCRASTGTCGAWVDVSSINGPTLGCTDFGAGGGGPQKCGGSSGSCDLCVQTKCAAEANKCMQTPACNAILNCASGCMDQACVDKCVVTNPAGQPVFYGFMTCLQSYCAAECQ